MAELFETMDDLHAFKGNVATTKMAEWFETIGVAICQEADFFPTHGADVKVLSLVCQ
jgi:uncharacterized protein YkuJ